MPYDADGNWTSQNIPDPITGSYDVPELAPPTPPGDKGPLIAAHALPLVQKQIG